MLDIRRIRNEPEAVRAALARRGEEFPIDQVLELDEEHRRLLAEVEDLKARHNRASEAIGRARREGKDAAEDIAEMRRLSQEIKARDDEVDQVYGPAAGAALAPAQHPPPVGARRRRATRTTWKYGAGGRPG